MEHAYSNGNAPAPELYARYTLVKELCVSWDAVGGEPEAEEIGLLAELVNVQREAQALQDMVRSRGNC